MPAPGRALGRVGVRGVSREGVRRQSQDLVTRIRSRRGPGLSRQEEPTVNGSITTTMPCQGSPVRACSCRIKAQKQHQCRGAAESNIRNLNHSPSLIGMEHPGEGQDTGVQVRVGNLATNGGEPGFVFTDWWNPGIPVDIVINDKCHLLYCQGAKYFTCILLTVGCKLWAEKGSRFLSVVMVPPCSRTRPSGMSPASAQLPEDDVGPRGACALPLCGQQRWSHRASSESWEVGRVTHKPWPSSSLLAEAWALPWVTWLRPCSSIPLSSTVQWWSPRPSHGGRSSSSSHSPQRTSKARGVATSACTGSGKDGSRHDTDLGRVLLTWNQPFSPNRLGGPLEAFPASQFVAACHHHCVLPAQCPGGSHEPGVAGAAEHEAGVGGHSLGPYCDSTRNGGPPWAQEHSGVPSAHHDDAARLPAGPGAHHQGLGPWPALILRAQGLADAGVWLLAASGDLDAACPTLLAALADRQPSGPRLCHDLLLLAPGLGSCHAGHCLWPLQPLAPLLLLLEKGPRCWVPAIPPRRGQWGAWAVQIRGHAAGWSHLI